MNIVKRSPTLRFIVFGAAMYVLSSLQGSMEALRTVNYSVHFTHYTVGHAHLGLYAFFTMILFGAIYFLMPRMIDWEWPSPKLISIHFWSVTIGVLLYVVALSIAGVLQGQALNDASIPFIESVKVTIPYLQIRSFAGILILFGHLAFALHLFMILNKEGQMRSGPTLIDNKATA